LVIGLVILQFGLDNFAEAYMIMTFVTETKLENEFYVGEEGAIDPYQDANAPPPEERAVRASFQGFERGSLVAEDTYLVPEGVAVEELKNYGGHKDLKNTCPDEVRVLLTKKSLFDVYDKFVQSIVDTRNTRSSVLGKWKDAEFVGVLDQFSDDFAEKGVRVALCKRTSGKRTYRWLEFIDVDAMGDAYEPQYDYSNRSGQIIKTCYTKLKFPNGVAVEELKSWKGREKLKEKTPIYVEKMLDKYELRSEYDQMVSHFVEAGVGRKFKNWNTGKLRELLDQYKPLFAAKGVEIFVSHKQEWISHGQYGGHFEHFRWIEFVDRAVQPSYLPQRDAHEKKAKDECAVM